MTADSILFVHELMRSASFPDVLREIVEEETGKGKEALRQLVTRGDWNAASRCEGQIRAFEELPSIFKRHAAKYKIDTAA